MAVALPAAAAAVGGVVLLITTVGNLTAAVPAAVEGAPTTGAPTAAKGEDAHSSGSEGEEQCTECCAGDLIATAVVLVTAVKEGKLGRYHERRLTSEGEECRGMMGMMMMPEGPPRWPLGVAERHRHGGPGHHDRHQLPPARPRPPPRRRDAGVLRYLS